jgi:hypothetical protein
MKQIEAYYCSWVFPPKSDGYVEVSLQYTDDTWESLFKRPLSKLEGPASPSSLKEVARITLENYFQNRVAASQITRLSNMSPGYMMRMEPIFLDQFGQMSF